MYEEVHQVVTASGWRVSMSAVKMLAMLNIPKVLVSATLPPGLLPRLLKACWISEVTEIRVPVTANLAK